MLLELVNIVKINPSFDSFLGLCQKKRHIHCTFITIRKTRYGDLNSLIHKHSKFQTHHTIFSKQDNLCNYNMAYNVDKTISMWSPYIFFIGKSKCHFHHTQRVNFHCWDWTPGVHVFATTPAISTSKQRPVLSCLMYPFYNKQTKQSQRYI